MYKSRAVVSVSQPALTICAGLGHSSCGGRTVTVQAAEEGESDLDLRVLREDVSGQHDVIRV